jgi:hypothetical protein
MGLTYRGVSAAVGLYILFAFFFVFLVVFGVAIASVLTAEVEAEAEVGGSDTVTAGGGAEEALVVPRSDDSDAADRISELGGVKAGVVAVSVAKDDDIVRDEPSQGD